MWQKHEPTTSLCSRHCCRHCCRRRHLSTCTLYEHLSAFTLGINSLHGVVVVLVGRGGSGFFEIFNYSDGRKIPPKIPQIVGSAVCGALLPTIGTVTGGFSLLRVHRLLDLPLVVPCHSPDGLDAACVRKPPLVCEVSPAVCPPSALIWADDYCPSSWSRAGGSSPPPSGL